MVLTVMEDLFHLLAAAKASLDILVVQVNVSDTIDHLAESRGITARSRRRHSGTALTFDPMRSRARRREESSDRNLTIPAPTHDDNGVHAVSKEERQCSPAQVLPTVDVQDDEAVPALVSVSPKKLQVASAALINAANARRTNEAPFRCTFAGCKATFTAKHNLNICSTAMADCFNHTCRPCEFSLWNQVVPVREVWARFWNRTCIEATSDYV
ncbi:hypothetical protein FB446DRAFT_701415 [Lentinula raphanica]|nr:hypothetical protein FB446DRAFT_701415 [Lentinula raphanica]